MSPEARVSRPTTTRPPPTYVPNACANEHASAGVRKSPTTPRIPETPIFSRCSRLGILCKTPDALDERVKQFARRISPLLANNPHHGLGLTHSHVKPAVRPVHAQAVYHARAPIGIALAQRSQQRRNAVRYQRYFALQNGIL